MLKTITMLATMAVLAFAGTNYAYSADVYTPDDAYSSPVQSEYGSWNGNYVTVFGGYGLTDWKGPLGYSDRKIGDTFDSSNREIKDDTWFGGVALGTDRQYGKFVAGVVADVAYGDIGDTNTFVPYPNGKVTWDITTEIQAFGTLRARVGYLLTDKLLAYGTGGLAWAMVDSSIEPLHGGVNTTDAYATAENNHIGYAVGGGLEYKITDHVSINAEYLYVDLGEQDYRFAGSKSNGNGIYATDSFNPKLEMDLIKAGLNYRF